MFIKEKYPKLCLICGKKISEKSSFTCEMCTNILKYELNEGVRINISNMYFDELYSAFLYTGFIRSKILEFKFYNKPYLGKVFAKILTSIFIKNGINVDAIIPVPIHYRRYMERGYNQSKIIAKYISNKTHVYMPRNVLKKIINSNKQSKLNAIERKKNVLNSFKVVHSRNIQGKIILLVDDIYTTGATVNECSRILKENGARKVIVMTIAYGKLN